MADFRSAKGSSATGRGPLAGAEQLDRHTMPVGPWAGALPMAQGAWLSLKPPSLEAIGEESESTMTGRLAGQKVLRVSLRRPFASRGAARALQLPGFYICPGLYSSAEIRGRDGLQRLWWVFPLPLTMGPRSARASWCHPRPYRSSLRSSPPIAVEPQGRGRFGVRERLGEGSAENEWWP